MVRSYIDYCMTLLRQGHNLSLPSYRRFPQCTRRVSIFVPVGNFQIRTESSWTGDLEPPGFDFNVSREFK